MTDEIAKKYTYQIIAPAWKNSPLIVRSTKTGLDLTKYLHSSYGLRNVDIEDIRIIEETSGKRILWNEAQIRTDERAKVMQEIKDEASKAMVRLKEGGVDIVVPASWGITKEKQARADERAKFKEMIEKLSDEAPDVSIQTLINSDAGARSYQREVKGWVAFGCELSARLDRVD